LLNGAGGADTLIGGLGDDTYVVDNAGDVVTEQVGEGTDTVQSSITYSLPANVEALVLTGTANINGTGNALANGLTGNAGANTLDGGTGADTMSGGAGNDTYIVDDPGDVVIEAAGGGTDTVRASISYTLPANVENLVLTGTASINAAGNDVNNSLTGNAGNNLLDGGLGADTMAGGAGDDTYIVDNPTDVVTESSGAGTDSVLASVTFTLSSNVDNLVLTGTGNINGTGSSLANTITGNAGNNLLNGAGGADTLIGGLGDDTYVVDNAGDVVTEQVGEGTDTVQSSVTYTLPANVENIVLTGSSAANAGRPGSSTWTGTPASHGGLCHPYHWRQSPRTPPPERAWQISACA
jgi:Ca2+-binding RTX toxin-like protein